MAKQNAFSIGKVFTRYVILLFIIVLSSYDFFYKFLLTLTIYPAAFILKLFYNLNVIGNIMVLGAGSNVYHIEIIAACVAISAYCLLLILNLTTQMTRKQRVYSICFSVISLLIVNIIRIAVFSILYTKSLWWFNTIHLISWYSLNIIIVVLIWFASVYIFKINNIPVYDDFKNIRRSMKRK